MEQFLVSQYRPFENTDGLYMDDRITLEAWLETAKTMEEAMSRHCNVDAKGLVKFVEGDAFGRRSDPWAYWSVEPVKTRIVNCTPHEITILLQDGTREGNYNGADPADCLYPLHIPSTSNQARCKMVTTSVGEINGISIPMKKTIMGEISGLPKPENGTIYIVSLSCAQKVWSFGRSDCVVTNETVRDSDGHITGCKSLGVSPNR